ncbi:hypothetical protein Taro_044118 [Colocasia esculenta]|uniref:Tyrosyl-DNA phosphodiesterase 1 n=1 Tax=Colocasia esculenta TaxID=4460 RepID=A0A843WMX0_COLES|nr:hypothetical protein [Colocasia esculenta]
MALRSPVGFLVPLKADLSVDASAARVPILAGANALGRSDLPVSDRRVSRRHASLHASGDGGAELVVEGPNPVAFRSGNQRRMLFSRSKASVINGDVLELIPGRYFFRYVSQDSEKHTSPSNTDETGNVPEDNETLKVKRKRHILEDETLMRPLQEKDNSKRVGSSLVTGCSDGLPDSNKAVSSHNGEEVLRHFSVSEDALPSIFRLLRVKGIDSWANSSAVGLNDVIQGNVLVAVLSNYMVDIDWLLNDCPTLRNIPHVLVIHGESGHTLEYMKKKKPANWILHKPSLPISYGTHHSKAMLLVYPQGLRVVVHTANLIYVDWNNKTQGLWMQDFPLKDESSSKRGCPFESDLVEYINVLKWPEFSVILPSIGHININPSFFKKFDYCSAVVRLVASVPGYHTGSNLKRWGHMKLRAVLEECTFDKVFQRSPLVYQFSSLGSLDEKWLSELAVSMSSGVSDDKAPLGLGRAQIIWPAVEDVRCSLEGYAAGNAIPSPQKNVEKEFLKKYWAKWKAENTRHSRAMPHIKSYTRYSGQKLAWFLLTSANLSKAAWGALQKNNSQLFIRSYELGVLFLPYKLQGRAPSFSCTDSGHLAEVPSKNHDEERKETKFATLCWQENKTTDLCNVIRLPVPYELPPPPYTSEDVPWSWDRRYTKRDVYGQVWPRHVQLYMEE